MTARLVIAASRSGEGKTSVTLGLAAALRARGLRVSVAKVGPDYLDTGWHSLAAGRAARNLDVWTMGESGVRAAFSRAAEDADIVLIEGVMGLFDGHRTGAAATSTADVARLLDAPVVLVADASHSAASVAALAHGFASFDPSVRVAGVVLNRFGVHRDRTSIETAFERTGLPVLGWLPREERAELGSRHLGLVQSGEDEAAACEAIAALGDLVETHAQVDALVAIARDVSPLPATSPTWAGLRVERAVAPRIAVARDEAFAFYYADNLEALRDLGAQVVEFSPLRDAALPEGVHGVYLGGGYPELHAAALSANASMRASIARAAASGVPVYAECGGMLYLLRGLADAQGETHEMVGLLSASAAMQARLQRVGYVEATLAGPCALGDTGARVRGHEFRYSACEPASGANPLWLVDGEPRGFREGSVVASYLHLNFAGCPDVAAAFLEACAAHAASMVGGTDD